MLQFVIRPFFAPMAQLVEQLTLNQWVPGSSPGGCTSDQQGDEVPRTGRSCIIGRMQLVLLAPTTSVGGGCTNGEARKTVPCFAVASVSA